MPHDMQAFADMMAVTITAALAPMKERLAASEQAHRDLLARLQELSGLRDRVTVVETKSAVAPLPPDAITRAEVSEMITNSLASFVSLPNDVSAVSSRVSALESRPAPVLDLPPLPSAAELELSMRDRVEPLTKTMSTLSERIAVLETRAPIPGPPGQDGADGKDGRDGADGLGFDDVTTEFDGDRTITIKGVRGNQTKTLGTVVLPYMRQKGVWVEGQSYVQGDVVTWGGSQWHCNEPTTLKPGEGLKAWTLVVKRGRDGKDGKDAPMVPVVKVG